MCGRSARVRRDSFQMRCEGGIVELQAAVGGEHGDRLVEAVERFALHADQRVIAAFECEPLGLVDIEVGHAAVGPQLRDDMQHAAIGEVPPLVERRAGLVARQRLRLPFGILDHLGQPAEGAQAVEHGAVGGAGFEPARVELPQLLERLVEEREPLFLAEDRHGRRHPVERAVVGGDLTVELALCAFDGGDVDGDAGGCILQRQHDDVVGLAFAADDQMHSLTIALAAADRGLDRSCAVGFRSARSDARSLRRRSAPRPPWCRRN